jgi:allantoate deiminase
MKRLEILGRVSDEPNRLTRTFCSPGMRSANELVGGWMRQAGMQVRQDAIGNLRGYFPGSGPEHQHGSSRRKSEAIEPERQVLLLGSHLDTVRNAGKFDGALGVLLAIACVEELSRANERLPFGLEVICFADEEGVRYQTAYLGSRVLAGSFDMGDLQRKDSNGVSMAEACLEFTRGGARIAGVTGKGTRERKKAKANLRSLLKRARFDPARVLGYIEAHIEQGPVLEQQGLGVGVVSAIAGQSRFRITFFGQAGHAGTTPMRARRDALCAAAEFILAVEKLARRTPGLVATVGQVAAEPNASNVIPGSVTLSLDVRHQRDAVRIAAVGRLVKYARQLGAARGIKVAVQAVQQTQAVPCSRPLSALLKSAARAHQREVLTLPSGAGHDAAIMARIAPVAMLFIRCKGGVSHHPDESVSIGDVQLALAVLRDFVRLLALRVSVSTQPKRQGTARTPRRFARFGGASPP